MKKFLVLFVALMMVMPMALASDVDAFTSASVADYYGAEALTGDDLMNAVNGQSGCYLVSTTNPDGTPNTAYFVFGIKKLDDKYYLQLGLADNQSKANLEATGEGLAVFGFTPEGMTFAAGGARMYFKAIEDQAILAELMKDARETQTFYEITEVLPLG